MSVSLTCPECEAVFDFDPPVIHFFDKGGIPDDAPARCPNGHVHMYRFIQPRDGDR
jgi:hypothetical protein